MSENAQMPTLPMKKEGVVWLYAPESYIQALPAVRTQVVNGCGPAGWKRKLISDKLWGLNVKVACDIHDWMYTVGETLADKEEADRVFRNNMLRMIEAAGGPAWLQALRRRRAQTYYLAVEYGGGPAFWHNKNGYNKLLAITLKGGEPCEA